MPSKKRIQLVKNDIFKQKFQAWLEAPGPESPALHPWQRRGLLCCLISIFGLIVSSHPLTPFFAILSVGLMVLFRCCYPFWLPILMAVMTAAWIFIMMHPYLSQHVGLIVTPLGNLVGNVPTSIVTGKMGSSALYQIVARTRLSMTVLIWSTAFLGCIKRLRQGHRDLTYILLAVSGFPLIAAQRYGGEMLLRIYLFTEPFMVFFVAALFCESPLFSLRTHIHARTASTSSLWSTAAMIGASLILLSGLFFARYGDDRVNFVSPAEWDAVQHLYQIAPAGSSIFTAWSNTPVLFENYEKYHIEGLGDPIPDAVIHADVNKVVQFFARKGGSNSYLVFTQEQQILLTAWDGLPTNILQRLETRLLQTGKFKLIYRNDDAQILQFIGSAGGGAS